MANETNILYRCTLCPYIYDEIKEGKKWEELPEDWICPECGAAKEFFEKLSQDNLASYAE